jgi:uncharacterized protein YndB with AHSA1/START domain
MERWMCRDAAAHVIRYLKFDFREGGECVLDIDIGKGQRYIQYLRYQTIVPSERIVWVWEGEQLDATGKMIYELRGTRVTVLLTASRGGTDLTLTHEFLPDAQSIADHRRGWNGCIEVLVSLLAENPSSDARQGSMTTSGAAPKPVLELKRTFGARREKVFDAWVKPELMARWFCSAIPNRSGRIAVLDARPGGLYLIEVDDSSTGTRYQLRGEYREVRRPERLVFTWEFEPDPEFGKMTIHLDFIERGADTDLILTQVNFPSAASRDGHGRGWKFCLDALGDYLEE